MNREKHELIKEAISKAEAGGTSRRQLARDTGISETTVANFDSQDLRDEGEYKSHPVDERDIASLKEWLGREPEAPKEGIEITDTPDGRRIRGTVSEEIISYKQVFDKFSLDPDEWEVTKLRCKAYQQGMKLNDGPEQKPHVTQLYSISVDLKPRHAAITKIAAAEALLERFGSTEIIVSERPRIDKGEPHLLVFNMQDTHVGKLAADGEWAVTDAIAEHGKAVRGILDYVPDVQIDEALYYIGPDLSHVDNVKGQTTRGTQVESNDTYENIFDAGCDLSIRTVGMVREVAARVRLGLVNGNHDWNSGYGIARYVHAWFRQDDAVEVILGKNGLLPYEYGQNFLLGVHGNNAKPDHSAMSLALLFKEAWGRTKYREVHQGHIHRRQANKLVSCWTEEHGVVVRTCGSLSPTDNWHQIKGFLGGLRTAEAYLYGRDSGPRAVINYTVQGDVERTWGWTGKSA